MKCVTSFVTGVTLQCASQVEWAQLHKLEMQARPSGSCDIPTLKHKPSVHHYKIKYNNSSLTEYYQISYVEIFQKYIHVGVL